MFCQQCGTRNTDSVSFCQNCGAPLTKGQSAYQQPNPTLQYQQTMHSQHAGASSGLALLKQLCTCPVALVAIIAYTAAALFSFMNSINGSSGIFAYIYQLADMLDMEDMIWNIYDYIQSASLISMIIRMIPTVLIAIGLWITYASAVNKNNTGMKTSGLTLIKVILIINLVCICIAFGMVEIFALVAAVNLSNSYFGSSTLGYLVGAMLGIAIAMTLIILFYVKAVKSINTIRLTAQSGIPSDKVSAYVAVMAFIMGGFTALSIFGSHGAFALLVNLGSATASISFGIFLFSYRGKMRAAANGMGNVNAKQSVYDTQTLSYSVPGAPESQNANYNHSTGSGQETTVLSSNAPQQLVTCSKCGGQYGMPKGQKCRCPYCGNIEN